jgi:hypothetical protein
MLPGMWVLPLAASLIALAFAGAIGRRWAARGRAFHGAWTLALLMYSAASIALTLGVLDGWSAAELRVYWAFGAVLNVPWLALGEAYLLLRRRWLLTSLLALLVFLTAFTIAQVRGAPVDADALAEEFPLGREVFGDGSLPYRLAQLLSYPAYLLLLAGCAWSAWRMRGHPELRDRFVGTLLIAVGATIVAIGSGVGAGLEVVWLFTAGLALGIAVMFVGFLRVSGPVRPRPRAARDVGGEAG